MTSRSENEPVLPAMAMAPADRPVALHRGALIDAATFVRHVTAVALQLRGASMLNLCEDRYWFMVAFAAAQQCGHSVLLPSSRAEQIVAEVEATYVGSYRCDDAFIAAAVAGTQSATTPLAPVRAAQVCMIGFTSGSTGVPRAFPKTWGSVSASTAMNAAAIRAALELDADATLWAVATVPPQHMYGMELSILLPLIAGVAVHAGRPLFPADIAAALADIPAPRVLVSTPVHLRALLESAQSLPPVALIISATAPLDQELALQVEQKLGGRLLELFGSTETCVFARRRTAVEPAWHQYEGVTLQPQTQGTLVDAPWFAAPLLLQDIVEQVDAGRFIVRGRNADMIEVAGKRASLADLTRRLLAIEGVVDAVVFQPDAAPGGVRRVAALVVTAGLTAAQVLDRLGEGVDPAFLPRPLRIVDRLPRNELGKLPREALLAELRKS